MSLPLIALKQYKYWRRSSLHLYAASSERMSSLHVFHLFVTYITGEADMGENAAATPAKAMTRIARRICNVTQRLIAHHDPLQ
jgi:hypothetical protein